MSPMQPGQNTLPISTAIMSSTGGPINPNTPVNQQQQQQHQQQQSPSPQMAGIPSILSPASALEHYRLSQLYQYAIAAERLRCPPNNSTGTVGALAAATFFPGLRPDLSPFLYNPYCRFDTRLALCRPPEEPKPQHSYIGLIAMAILSSQDKKLVLSDIYKYILDNYPYFRSRGPGWRNSIRHNLSLNDCFIKAGRSANGKGHYWAIHPANLDDFTKGDFRRRKAQRKVRRHMGLAVDDEDSPSPPPSNSPPPPINWPDHHHTNLVHHHLVHHHPSSNNGPPAPPIHHHHHHLGPHFPIINIGGHTNHSNTNFNIGGTGIGTGTGTNPIDFFTRRSHHHHESSLSLHNNTTTMSIPLLVSGSHQRKRQFDVASLLAPEKLFDRDIDSGRSDDEQSRISNPNSPLLVRHGDDDDDGDDDNNIKSKKNNLQQQQQQQQPITSEEDDEADDEEDESEQIEVEDDENPNNNKSKPVAKNIQVGNNLSSGDDDESNDEPISGGGGGAAAAAVAIAQSLCQSHFSNSSSSGGGNSGRLSLGMSPLEFHHHQQQQLQHQHQQQQISQLPPGFHLTPSHLLHNPSLASLMILSSRYRELTSLNMASSGGTSTSNSNSTNHSSSTHKRHAQ